MAPDTSGLRAQLFREARNALEEAAGSQVENGLSEENATIDEANEIETEIEAATEPPVADTSRPRKRRKKELQCSEAQWQFVLKIREQIDNGTCEQFYEDWENITPKKK